MRCSGIKGLFLGHKYMPSILKRTKWNGHELKITKVTETNMRCVRCGQMMYKGEKK